MKEMDLIPATITQKKRLIMKKNNRIDFTGQDISYKKRCHYGSFLIIVDKISESGILKMA